MSNQSKIRVALIFGGKSGEHEVSLQSAKSIYEALDKQKYEVKLIGIDKGGKWYLGNAASYLLNDKNPKLISLNKLDAQEVTAIVHSQSTQLISIGSGKEIGAIDVVFPITHGTFGEDGSLQGFLELLNVAYVGAGVLGSAIGMDKEVMKKLLNDAGIVTAKYKTIRKSQFDVIANLKGEAISQNNEAILQRSPRFARDDKEYLDEIISYLGGFPLFVKPANMGSSVGISKAHNSHELFKAIEDAFLYDTKILIEEYIAGREIEVAVLGNDNPIASIPGEIKPKHEFYSYEAKYIDENGADFIIPAKLHSGMKKRIQEIAIKASQTLQISGMARVDFFLTDQHEIILNEINTLPGFTKISMYPKLWEASGLPYSQLLDKLIQLAMEKKKEKDSLKRVY